MGDYILKTEGDIAAGAYKGDKEIVGVIISKDTKIIAREAFENCSNIESIEFEEDSSLERIEAWAFAACGKIKKIDFPDRKIRLDAKAFYKCDSIEYLKFGKEKSDIHYDAFPSRILLKEVHIPGEALDFNAGLDYIPSYISGQIDLCRLMLDCDRNKTFDSGLSLGTLLDMAIRECVKLGELNENADSDEIYRIFSKYNYTTAQKEYAPTNSAHPIERDWIVFPEDHFYTRLANAIFSNRAFNRKNLRRNTIALLSDKNREYSQTDIDTVSEYANIVGYKFEILKPIGRMQLGWDDDASPKLWDEIPGCEYEEDDNFDEVGVLYEDILSGKIYAMNSDYHTQNEGMFMMIYHHFLEEMTAIDSKDLYDAKYKFQSGNIEFKDIEYLEICKSD